MSKHSETCKQITDELIKLIESGEPLPWRSLFKTPDQTGGSAQHFGTAPRSQRRLKENLFRDQFPDFGDGRSSERVFGPMVGNIPTVGTDRMARKKGRKRRRSSSIKRRPSRTKTGKRKTNASGNGTAFSTSTKLKGGSLTLYGSGRQKPSSQSPILTTLPTSRRNDRSDRGEDCPSAPFEGLLLRSDRRFIQLPTKERWSPKLFIPSLYTS